MNKTEEILKTAATKASKILHIPLGDIDPAQLLRMYSLLYVMFGLPDDQERGDEQMIWWLNTHNNHLGFCPATRLHDKQSMEKIIGYLDSMCYR
jgi:RimJ/RimL family protein N-acetyltransferase